MEFGGSALLTLLKGIAALAPFFFQNAAMDRTIEPMAVSSIIMVEDFEGPYGLKVLEDGSLFVADAPRGHVVRFSPALKREGTLGTSDPKEFPHAIAQDATGNFLVPDHRSGWIKRYTGNGTFLGLFTSDAILVGPVHVHADQAGAIFVTDYKAHRVLKFTALGSFAGWIGARTDGAMTEGWTMDGTAKESTTPGGFHQPHMTTTDNAGNIYVVDTGNHRIQKFSPTGKFLGWTGMPQAGSTTNGWASAGLSASTDRLGGFHRPTAVTYAKEENFLIVTDTENNRIVRLGMDGKVEGWLGEDEAGTTAKTWRDAGISRKGSEPGAFTSPFHAELHGEKLYVADTGNKRVQIMTLPR